MKRDMYFVKLDRGCDHKWFDLPYGHQRVQKKGVVRFWFYCDRCLKIETREVPEDMWEWKE